MRLYPFILTLIGAVQKCFPQGCNRERMAFEQVNYSFPTSSSMAIKPPFPMQHVENCIERCRETPTCKSCGLAKQGGETFCHLFRRDRFLLPLPTSPKPGYLVKYSVPHAKDCKDVYERGFIETGVYKVGELYRYCEMNYLGGGWTVVVNRINGVANFNKTWNSYKEGFGNLKNEFWLGNEYLHLLTKDTENEVLFVMKKFTDSKEYMALYDGFSVGDNSTRYRLTTGTYTEDGIAFPAGDSFSYHDSEDFKTYDNDNSYLCAQYSAWWMKKCYKSALNGRYSSKGSCEVKCIHWGTLSGFNNSLEKVTMMEYMNRKVLLSQITLQNITKDSTKSCGTVTD
ncbi:ficolin-1-like [Hydractinia symbiolongicarpus]|uniref:ficolin-1-like n=1 Tax=Hydractinia symbiolongicarpus TaxID=13093 RepID=UPI00254FCEE9|nr:ficolin-1-like [Hydractinia symbiolongicarpus]